MTKTSILKGYSDAYANLGLIYKLSGNDREAEANLKKSAELGSRQAQEYLD